MPMKARLGARATAIDLRQDCGRVHEDAPAVLDLDRLDAALMVAESGPKKKVEGADGGDAGGSDLTGVQAIAVGHGQFQSG